MEEVQNTDYDVLGYRVRLDSSQKNGTLSADDIVDIVRKEAELINKSKPGLDKGQLAILVALKLASDKLSLDREFKESVDMLQHQAEEAFKKVQQFSTEARA